MDSQFFPRAGQHPHASPPPQPALTPVFLRYSLGTRTVCLVLIFSLLTLNYARSLWIYHRTSARRLKDADGAVASPAERPPVYPSFVPYLGSFVAFAWDNAGFIRRATTYQGKPTASRIAIFPGVQIYLFRDPDTVRDIFKNSELGSPLPVYCFALNRFFGLPRRAVKVYQADDSGRGAKPHAHATVTRPDARPFHVTHKGLVQGLTGPGLAPLSRRYIDNFARDLGCYLPGSSSSAQQWTDLPDLFHLVQHTAGRAMIAAHFGPALLRRHPSYMDDLWAVDAGIPWFARLVPRFVRPAPHRARDRLVRSLMDLYAHAREQDAAHGSVMDADGDGDAVWGSSLNRYRQKTLYDIKEHDDRAVASLDVGHSWGSTSNVVATIFMALYHIYTSPALLARLRTSIAATIGAPRITRQQQQQQQQQRVSDLLDPKTLQSNHLLCAIYAETLRLHGMAHFLVSVPGAAAAAAAASSSPQQQQQHSAVDVPLGRKWLLPRGCIGVLSSGISHADASFWNTGRAAQQQHPVSDFWPDRFLVDPRDPLSGPVNPALRVGMPPYARPASTTVGEPAENNAGLGDEEQQEQPFFTLEGTDGHWFPYGGGSGMCGGRFLAKNTILATLAYLVLEFDIEPQVETMVVNPWRYGLGVNQPKYATPFRIRRRL